MALLLAKGATATDANSFGSTCLHMAARAPQQASACVALLLAHGAGESVQVANNRGSSPLHFAAFAKPESEAVATVLLCARAHVSLYLERIESLDFLKPSFRFKPS
jgi:ankyrin repeat protein